MAIKSMFFDAVESGGVYDRIYDSSDFTGYLDKVVGNGVFNNPSTQLQVRAGTGMQVIVAAGQGWIDGHKMNNTADYPISIDASDVLLDRIDRVIFYLDVTNREMGISVKKGTNASNPQPPAWTRTETRYEMALADVLVSKGVTSLNNFLITDTRGDSNICGWVTGLIEQLDTSTLFQQYSAAYAQQLAVMQSWQEQMRVEFEDWMETLTDELNVNTYIEAYDKTVTGTGAQIASIPLDMAGYTYEASDILMVDVNGLLTEAYTVDTTGLTPTVVLTITNTTGTGNRAHVKALKSKIGFNTIVGSDDSTIVGSDNSEIIGS